MRGSAPAARPGRPAAVSRLAPACALILGTLAFGASPAAGQERQGAEPRDSAAAADSAAQGDTLAAGEDQRAIGDSVPADTSWARLASLLEPDPGTLPGQVTVWDREAILRSNAQTLLDLLENAPGIGTLRASYFGGPLQGLDGPYGPGFVRVVLDGRPVAPLQSGQPDLSRFSLAPLESVRLVREPAGWTVELQTLRRENRAAYSRVDGGTGDPGLSQLALVFQNGIGHHLNLSLSGASLNTGGDLPLDLFDFRADVEWTPGDGGSGVEAVFSSQSVDRRLIDPVSEKFDRREAWVRARVALGSHLQLEAHGGESRLAFSSDATEEAPPDRVVSAGGIGLRGVWGSSWARLTADGWHGPAWPRVGGEVAAGTAVLGDRLRLDAGARVDAWREFTTGDVRGGAALSLPLGLTLSVAGASGKRGVPVPAEKRADSTGFRALSGRVDLSIGPVRAYGLVADQRLDRSLPFRAVFDRYLTVDEAVDLTSWEGGLDVPVLPTSFLIRDGAPIRVRGFWRVQSGAADAGAPYLPENLGRGEVYFHDRFFTGNLEVRLAVGLESRGAMLAPDLAAASTPTSELVPIDSRTSWDFDLDVRVLRVLVYWRYDNMAGTPAQDLVNLPFPVRRSVFGVRWEFLN